MSNRQVGPKRHAKRLGGLSEISELRIEGALEGGPRGAAGAEGNAQSRPPKLFIPDGKYLGVSDTVESYSSETLRHI
jgi:hypothetical protein